VGLTAAVARAAAAHAHALVVEVPGWWRTRVAVEGAVLARGWSLAFSPADADVLIVCGEPGPRLGEAIELVWHQMPGPRERVDLREHDDVTDGLDDAHTRLLDTTRHQDDARQRPDAADLLDEAAAHGGMDHGEHGAMDHGEHDGHDDMDMSPGGIPLAEGGEDRDGLEMDVLDVRLGPVLPHWPAGLVIRCSLQGDVIATARAELVDGTVRHEDAAPGPARRIDNITSLLALAGWDDAAADARSLRDAAVDHGGTEQAGAQLTRLARRVRRSRLLRWSLRGLSPLDEQHVRQHGLPRDAIGDTFDRLVGMLDRAAAGATVDRNAYSTEHLAHLVTGLDLAAARLVIASLDVHEVRAGHEHHEVSHG
jgi:hypothetical protein